MLFFVKLLNKQTQHFKMESLKTSIPQDLFLLALLFFLLNALDVPDSSTLFSFSNMKLNYLGWGSFILGWIFWFFQKRSSQKQEETE